MSKATSRTVQRTASMPADDTAACVAGLTTPRLLERCWVSRYEAPHTILEPGRDVLDNANTATVLRYANPDVVLSAHTHTHCFHMKEAAKVLHPPAVLI